MAEELQDPEDENQDDGAQSGEESPIDQSETDEMAQNAPESEANELESLLDDIEEDPDADKRERRSKEDADADKRERRKKEKLIIRQIKHIPIMNININKFI